MVFYAPFYKTLGSVLKSVYLGGKLKAVSFKGFILKILMAIFSYNLSRLVKVAT
jgi:hypothetical protein